MKAHAAGISLIAILFIVTGVGVGIAQAGGSGSERQILCFVLTSDQVEALEGTGASSPYVENRPVLNSEDEQIMAEGGTPSGDTMDLHSPIETGVLPSGDENPAVTELGGFRYRVGVDTGP